MSFKINIVKVARENIFFRKVLFTEKQSQLVVMSILPGEDIGEEVHVHVEQTLLFLAGSGKAIINGVESLISSGDVVVVTPGTRHNFINTGSEPLKIFTVYTPPNHIDGRIHKTKQEAVADTEDEAFGEGVK